jgi:glutamyl/glutaminyl-tRNA synthetase
LRWAELRFTGTPSIQNPEHSHYREGLNILREKGSIYPCFCSRKTGLIRTDEGHLIYRGTCRNLPESVAEKRIRAGEPHVWRYKTPGDHIDLMDEQAGVIPINPNQWGGDFIVWKRDDTPGYPLASVLDDIDQGISEINRGRDLIPASASQIFLFEEFNSPPPRFLHFPLLLDEFNHKLSKRTREATPESHFTHFSHFFSQWCCAFHFTGNIASWQEITESEFTRAISMPDMLWNHPD